MNKLIKCAVVGKKFVWEFPAPNKIIARKIANDILFSEDSGLFCRNEISGTYPTFGYYWKAVGKKLEEVKNLQLKEGGEVIEIKRKRSQKIDAIYMTRFQTERHNQKGD